MKFDLNTNFNFLWCGIFTADDGTWIHEARICDSYEIFYVTSGTLYIAADEKKYTVNAGEYLITTQNTAQCGWKMSQCSFYWFHFSCDECGDEFPTVGLMPDKERVDKYYQLLQLNNGNKQTGGHIIRALLNELKNVCRNEQHTQSLLCYSIKKFIKYANPSELNLESLSKQFNYSKKHLSFVFKAETDTTLKKYIQSEIMNRAENLLRNTSFSIGYIATSLGYSDVHNFSNAFKKLNGFSPRQYRKK